METHSSVPEVLKPLINLIERLEENRNLRNYIFEQAGQNSGAISDLIERDIQLILQSDEAGGSIDVIPEAFGVPGSCQKLLLVIVYASERRATGIKSIKTVPAGDFEDVVRNAALHLKGCPGTEGVVFWSISSWHPYLWLKHKHEFLGLPIAAKFLGSGAVMI